MREKISVVIPVLDEAASIGQLVDELVPVLQGTGSDFEVIIVDDGSRDQSWEAIKSSRAKYPSVSGIRLGRNFGQTAALAAGISHTSGSIIITLDGDGQNDPSDIPRLLAKMGEGYDVVSGWRKSRKDPYFSRQVPSRIANWLIRSLSGVDLRDFGCSLKAYQAELIKGIRLYGEMHRMIPALASWSGATVAEIEVNHRPRKAGNSKYSLSRFFSVFFDLLAIKFFTAYFSRPLHLFGLAGFVLLVLSMASFIATFAMKIFQDMHMTRNPFLFLGILLMIISIQAVALGLLGEISIRIYYEAQHKSTYTIKEELGFK